MKNTFIFLVVCLLCSVAAMSAPPAAVPALNAEIRQLPSLTYLCLEGKGPYTRIPEVAKEFMGYFASSGAKAIDKELLIYWNSPLYVKPAELRWDIGFPVNGGQGDTQRLKAKKFPYRKIAVATHVGPYYTTYLTINALYTWITKNGYKTVGGPCVERYIDDPTSSIPDAQR
ncbi:MAG TPA: GyrI-like domain-containing protein, partial [Candidatus Ozemobacteraceae bacterium]|nr:GyrI-like domain-containing protein [Candidatus Ozemobacteraceae bacterium]